MTLALLALLGAPYIYDISSLRVNIILPSTSVRIVDKLVLVNRFNLPGKFPLSDITGHPSFEMLKVEVSILPPNSHAETWAED